MAAPTGPALPAATFVPVAAGGRNVAFVAALLLPALLAVVADRALRRGYRRRRRPDGRR